MPSLRKLSFICGYVQSEVALLKAVPHLTHLELDVCGLMSAHEFWPHLPQALTLLRLETRGDEFDELLISNLPRGLRTLEVKSNRRRSEFGAEHFKELPRALTSLTGFCFSARELDGFKDLPQGLTELSFGDVEMKSRANLLTLEWVQSLPRALITFAVLMTDAWSPAMVEALPRELKSFTFNGSLLKGCITALPRTLTCLNNSKGSGSVEAAELQFLPKELRVLCLPQINGFLPKHATKLPRLLHTLSLPFGPSKACLHNLPTSIASLTAPAGLKIAFQSRCEFNRYSLPRESELLALPP